jgi:glycosyltransferase involved in cell wall biosynthesis
MKLLMSVYACAPDRGSDHAVGWNWTTEAHRQGHQVWALASTSQRAAVEAACLADESLRGINWVFPKVKGWPLTPGVEPKWERTYNFLWQRAAIRHARDLHQHVHFDAIHHLTWAGIRAPTYLGSIGAPLIIGPIGGGETSPRSLRDAMGSRGRLLEMIRDISNATITINPMVRGGFRDAAAIFVSTSDTQRLFSGELKQKTTVFSQLCLPDLIQPRVPRPTGDSPKFLFAGRLLYWKGGHIALLAFSDVVKQKPGARLTIVGDGPERSRLLDMAANLGIASNVDFVSRVPQVEIFRLYDTHDLMLFPSLHDSGGFVVLEALARGLPVVCLDLGGPKEIVTAECGIVVSTAGRKTQQVAGTISTEILALLDDPDRLARLSDGGVARARGFTQAARVARLYGMVADIVARRGAGQGSAGLATVQTGYPREAVAET